MEGSGNIHFSSLPCRFVFDIVWFLSRYNFITEALKCKNMDGGEVDWWFFVKPPKVKNVLYADSANPKDAFKV